MRPGFKVQPCHLGPARGRRRGEPLPTLERGRGADLAPREGDGWAARPNPLWEGSEQAAASGQITFTRPTSFPSTSVVWIAQARQGSKEWIVRSASSGSFASAIGLPTSDAS